MPSDAVPIEWVEIGHSTGEDGYVYYVVGVEKCMLGEVG
jgi:hypothetical protein